MKFIQLFLISFLSISSSVLASDCSLSKIIEATVLSKVTVDTGCVHQQQGDTCWAYPIADLLTNKLQRDGRIRKDQRVSPKALIYFHMLKEKLEALDLYTSIKSGSSLPKTLKNVSDLGRLYLLSSEQMPQGTYYNMKWFLATKAREQIRTNLKRNRDYLTLGDVLVSRKRHHLENKVYIQGIGEEEEEIIELEARVRDINPRTIKVYAGSLELFIIRDVNNKVYLITKKDSN